MYTNILILMVCLSIFTAMSTYAMEKENNDSQTHHARTAFQQDEQNASDSLSLNKPKVNRTIPLNRRRTRSIKVGPDFLNKLNSTSSVSSKCTTEISVTLNVEDKVEKFLIEDTLPIEKHEPQIKNYMVFQYVELPALKQGHRRFSLVDPPKTPDANYQGLEGAISPMRIREPK